MRAAIITIFDKLNYGNRLQNYAVQYVLHHMQLETVTYAFDAGITKAQRIKYFLQKASGYRLPGATSFWKYYIPKCLKFEQFNRKHIAYKYINLMDEIDRRMDYYIVGSDQVWNPLWYDTDSNKKDAYLLTFAEKRKKVCFSPSFGLEELPEEWKPWFRKQLLEFEYISVRETAGVKIIRDLTGLEAEVLIDPTLMLSKEEWRKIAHPSPVVDYREDYIFVYFLGGAPENGKKDIEVLAQKYHYRIVDVLDMSKPEYLSDPGEFIYLLANAKMVLTDSFHGCVFSFMFDKPFWVYGRVNGMNMNSRIETFLGKFHLEGRRRDQAEILDDFETDFWEGKEILRSEKEKVRTFLKKSMWESAGPK